MWSDTLLAAERAHIIRLAIWGATSAMLGTALLTAVTLRRIVAPVLSQFAIQTVAWGSLNLTIVGAMWRGLSMRDISGATRLDRSVWFAAGLDAGLVGIGLTLTAVGWMLGRRLGLVGAGIGVIVQGLALLVLHLMFLSVLARLI